MPRKTHRKTTVGVVLPSDVKLVDLVHAAAERIAEYAGFDADESLNLGLAVREVAINSIVHGNREDPSRKVRVQFTVTEREVQIRVKDEGPGFDPARLRDPLEENKLLGTTGRGLLLVRAFVDDVRYRRRERSMEVVLVKRR